MNIDFLQQEEVKEFIQSNLNADVSKLLLNPPPQWKNEISLIVDQIISRNKARGKLDDWLSNHSLIFPPPISIEQASSLTTSNYKKNLIHGHHLIDLTGGMGIDCLILSENFTQTTYVEKNEVLCRLFQHNSHVLNQSVQVKHQYAEDFVKEFKGTAVFYLDPARRDSLKNRVSRIEDCSPNLLELLQLLRFKAEKVIVKLSPLLDLTHLIQTIPHITELHVISLKNDCKEILLLIDFNHNSSTPIIAANLETNHSIFEFLFEEEKQIRAEISQLKHYVYEPNTSILKAGAFNQIGIQFGVGKLAKNTHLYSSDQLVESFPGKIFEVIEQFDRKLLKKYAPKGMINVICRNYPLSAPEIKKKYKLNDGGEYFLISFRDNENKAKMVFTKLADR